MSSSRVTPTARRGTDWTPAMSKLNTLLAKHYLKNLLTAPEEKEGQ
jgi:hypothetical protein